MKIHYTEIVSISHSYWETQKAELRNEYFLGQQIAYWHLEKYGKPRESSRVSEKVSDRMIDSAVGSRNSSDKDDLHTYPTCRRTEG